MNLARNVQDFLRLKTMKYEYTATERQERVEMEIHKFRITLIKIQNNF